MVPPKRLSPTRPPLMRPSDETQPAARLSVMMPELSAANPPTRKTPETLPVTLPFVMSPTRPATLIQPVTSTPVSLRLRMAPTAPVEELEPR